MPEQLALPFTIDQAELTEFLEKYIALEEEIDRIKADITIHKEQYEDVLPLRAVLTAVKVVRARRKLERHAKEGFPLAHQDAMQGLIEQHYAHQEEAMAQLNEEAREL